MAGEEDKAYNEDVTLPLFLIPIIAGLTAQLLKSVLNRGWYTKKEERGELLPRYGGMPSAHTAFAFSLATVVFMVDGVASATFAMAASLVIFVIDDALRMRVFLGGHGRALRRLIDKLPAAERRGFPYLETHLGHRPFEVLGGAMLGILLTILLMWLVPIAVG